MCKYLQDNKCLIASELANKDCIVEDAQCNYCTTQANPSQAINVVTVSLAINNVEDKSWLLEKYRHLLQVKMKFIPAPDEGPGTELKKLIEWFIWDREVRNCRTCKDREERMNRWGVKGCIANKPTILSWLEESAKEKGYPFSKRIATAMINRAIRNCQ